MTRTPAPLMRLDARKVSSLEGGITRAGFFWVVQIFPTLIECGLAEYTRNLWHLFGNIFHP